MPTFKSLKVSISNHCLDLTIVIATEGKVFPVKILNIRRRSHTDALSMSSNYTFQWNWANTLNYTKAFGSHSVNVLIGSEAISNTYFNLSGFAFNFLFDDVNYMYLSAGEQDSNELRKFRSNN